MGKKPKKKLTAKQVVFKSKSASEMKRLAILNEVEPGDMGVMSLNFEMFQAFQDIRYILNNYADPQARGLIHHRLDELGIPKKRG